jgi:hypothetical protein
LSSQPPFRLQKDGDRWWLVGPEARPFFSLGVCVVTRGLAREEFDPENPGYAAWQHYADDQAWALAAQRRLLDWGFTTIGGWSDLEILRHSPARVAAETAVLHMGSTAGAPWWDMWDPQVVGRMEQVAASQILALRGDDHVIGYYSDNELGWWNATLFDMTLRHAPSSGQRRRLIQLLRDHYGGDWSRLLADFEPESAKGWQDLEVRGSLHLRPGGQGTGVMRQFLGMVADRYYQLVHEIIRKYDSRALILGDRYQSFYYPEVARAAAPYVDAISTNLNAQWNDGTFARFYLDTLYALTGKPVFVGEFYMAAAENRSGNRNSSGIFPVVQTQSDRAAALQTSLHGLAHHPAVVAADWFQYFDEPRHGRGDGENFNFGLVDITDHPYAEITQAFAATDMTRLRAGAQPPPADASSGVPAAPADPYAHFVATEALKHWDRQAGFVRPSSDCPLADLYLCWNPDSLYLGLFAMDVIEPAAYAGKVVPKIDRMLWTVQVDGGSPVAARIGAGREGLVNDPEVRVESLSSPVQDVRTIAILEIPARRLGKSRLAEGDGLSLQSTLVSHGRAYRTDWRGAFTLR